MKPLLCLLAFLGLAACAGGSGNNKSQIGDYEVYWNDVPSLTETRADGLTSLIFSFGFGDGARNTSVLTDEDWRQEAELQGTSLEIATLFRTGSEYKNEKGRIVNCTSAKIDKGICGRKLGLSVDQRAKMAEAILAQSPTCKWVGFDAAYNQLHSFRFGAASSTLHVRADC